MSEEKIEKLGEYFVHFQIYKRYGISFERFVEMVERDTWKDIVTHAC